jgi:CheY-like chemotaxis protein
MGHRLLVVDSDRRFLQDHKVSLESAFDVDFREGTEGTLSHLESGDYAAILLCVEASENKGYSLCSAIRRSPVLGDLKVVLISAKATDEEYARHQSLKGKADLYLHKPIRPNALVSALTPVVPLKSVDPDNPLGDLGGADLGDEWLESLKSELEVETVPSTMFEPPPPPPPPVPVSALLGFTRPLLPLAPPTLPPVPKDAGRVELLESRVKDLETKLVSTSDELDRANQALEELTRSGSAAQTLFEEKTLHAMELETRLAAAEAGLEQGGRDLEELTQQEQEARDLLQEKTQLTMDLMESNQLLQAQLAEAREDAERLSRSQLTLEARNRELEAVQQESRSAVAALEASLAELRKQLEGLEENHDRQQMELLAAIDDREARLGRMEETLNAQREQILVLEQEKETAAGLLQLRAERWLAVAGRLADLEGQVHQALEFTKLEMN